MDAEEMKFYKKKKFYVFWMFYGSKVIWLIDSAKRERERFKAIRINEKEIFPFETLNVSAP